MINSTKYIVFTLVIFSLFGCQTFQAPEVSYEMWSPPEDAVEPVDSTWRSIREKEIDTSRPLALVELIDIALSNNPDTHEAWENARTAEAVEGEAESQWYPQVNVSGDITRAKTVSSIEADDKDFLKYGPAVKITYLILDFGGRSAEVEEASQMLLAANYQFNQAIQDLVVSVEKAYYGLYSSYSVLNAAESDLEDAETALGAAKQKCEVGLGSKLDLLQEESNYNNALYNLEEAKEGVKTAKADLAQILGYPADTPFEIAAPAKEIPTEITDEDVSSLIEDALSKRMDIAAQRASVRAKEAAVTAANSDLFPKLNASGSADKNWYEYYNSEVSDGNDHTYSGYLEVEWDIFDGFYNVNKKKETQALLEAEKDKLKQAELQASNDVWRSYYAFESAVKKYKYSESFLDNAQASYDLALESYNVGLGSILDLLQAQASLSEARSKLIQSRKDLFYSLADMAHATGELYVKEINLPEELDIKGSDTYSIPDKNYSVRDRED